MTSAFHIDNVAIRFGDRAAVDGVSVEIPRGAVTAIVGPNGCGKSTLLRAMARLQQPDDGSIQLEQSDVYGMRGKQFATRVALLPQAPVAPDNLTVVDLVTRGRDPYRRWYDQWSAADERIVEEALRRTEMTEFADRPLESLSGGQRQRAWIALTFAQNTDVLLLDEPTTYLDIAHQLEVLDTVRDMHRERGVTVVMVLHDLSLAARYADNLIAMRDGQIIAAGTVHEVITPAVLRSVFGVECSVINDDVSGRPIVIPRSISRG
ncbi:ABC transporter ATP-binding protein [Glaciihabitans sp. dw_435]|uniref:ABC transporter ATP-binding protein n=1 Tax=Glaciihabitans sp. dw_435 TaxID=2720081 RepID=UPI001BD48D22|nr:ATP-binding cassette domain-containing protein [Glaciihabitans sp. dw_435]